MNLINARSLFNVAAGAPLAAAAVAAMLFRKIAKWFRRLVMLTAVCVAVLLVNNAGSFRH